MITANLATIKSRSFTLQLVVDSLRRQVDLVRVYANDYTPDIEGDNVEVYTGPDYTDNAKFYWLQHSKGVYLSCDDDLIYPSNYVETILKGLKKYPNTWITFHGRKLIGLDLKYYTGHKVYKCLGQVTGDYEIDVPGTGVSAVNVNTIKFDSLKWDYYRMSDIMVAKELAKQKIRVVCLGHKSGWIRAINAPDSIYKKEFTSLEQDRQANRVYLLKYGR